VVTEAPGVEIAADGIHWRVVSERAVKDLMQILVQTAQPTSQFIHTAPPNLWYWRYNPTWQRHFPTCITCKKKATRAHLDSIAHHERNPGLQLRINFPRREELCDTGVQFREITTDNSPGELITREWLQADHPLPIEPPTARSSVSASVVLEIEIISSSGTVEHRGHDKPQKFTAQITRSDGVMSTHTFTILHAGYHRVAYTTDDLPWVVKMQNLDVVRNHNKEEWDNSHRMRILSSLVPETHGYAEARIRDTDMSFLFLQRVGFTFAELVQRLSKKEPTETSMSMVAVAATTVVEDLVQAARDGLKPYDWHIGNVAFDDDDSILKLKNLKLIDWAGNNMATAPLSLRGRMHKAFVQFSGCFKEFTQWGYAGDNANTAQIWHIFMSSLHHALKDWWSPWASIAPGQDGDALPSGEQVHQLQYSLQNIVQGPVAMQHLPRTVSLKMEAEQRTESNISPGERGHPAPEQQDSETSVPDTVSPPTFPLTRRTAMTNLTDPPTLSLTCRTRKTNLTERTHPYPPNKTTYLSPIAEAEFHRDTQSAPERVATLEERSACTDQIEAHAEAHMHSLRVVVENDGSHGQLRQGTERALRVKTLAVRRKIERELYRHGRSTADKPGNSIPLQQRWTLHTHGMEDAFPCHTPPDNRAEGDDISVIFNLFLDEIKERGFLARMPKLPKACENPKRLHTDWWTKFTKNISWGSMTLVEKRSHFRKWLVQKFSLDPQRQCMSPLPGAKRCKNEAKWEGFEINDRELEELINSIFSHYETLY